MLEMTIQFDRTSGRQFRSKSRSLAMLGMTIHLERYDNSFRQDIVTTIHLDQDR